jgi:hypothetical protein
MFTNILKRYEAINTEQGTDKNTTHSYGQIYDHIFLKYKETCGNILEIGISGGHSLLAYADYFQTATIYGLDIEDKCNSDTKNHPRIKLQFGDAKSDEIVKSYEGKYFDLIIEDASHLPEDQIRHFMDYSKFLKDGSIYIIEDVVNIYLDYLTSILKPYGESQGFEYHVIDLQTIKNRGDDILIVFKKKHSVSVIES